MNMQFAVFISPAIVVEKICGVWPGLQTERQSYCNLHLPLRSLAIIRRFGPATNLQVCSGPLSSLTSTTSIVFMQRLCQQVREISKLSAAVRIEKITDKTTVRSIYHGLRGIRRGLPTLTLHYCGWSNFAGNTGRQRHNDAAASYPFERSTDTYGWHIIGSTYTVTRR